MTDQEKQEAIVAFSGYACDYLHDSNAIRAVLPKLDEMTSGRSDFVINLNIILRRKFDVLSPHVGLEVAPGDIWRACICEPSDLCDALLRTIGKL